MTALRKRMLEELQRRNYSSETMRSYLFAVKDFAAYFGKRPDQLGQEHFPQYQLHLLNDRKLAVATIVGRIAELRSLPRLSDLCLTLCPSLCPPQFAMLPFAICHNSHASHPAAPQNTNGVSHTSPGLWRAAGHYRGNTSPAVQAPLSHPMGEGPGERGSFFRRPFVPIREIRLPESPCPKFSRVLC